jgi:hypothetical protein
MNFHESQPVWFGENMPDLNLTTARAPRKSATAVEPLVVRPAEAWRMLGCGPTYGYELLGRGELDSFVDGGARKITVDSIKAYIAKKLATCATAKVRRSPRTASAA